MFGQWLNNWVLQPPPHSNTRCQHGRGVSALDTLMSGLAEGSFSVAFRSSLLRVQIKVFVGGQCHTIAKAEGGEQGDPLMPLLFALGQHRALVALHSRLFPSESLMAYLDDSYVVLSPERVEHVHTALEEELFRHCHIRVHARENSGVERGRCPTRCM